MPVKVASLPYCVPVHRGLGEVRCSKICYKWGHVMNYTKEMAHQEVEQVFRDLLPIKGLIEREEQIRLCHQMLDAMLEGSIALCDAGTGIGKTYAYLVAGTVFARYRAENRYPWQPLVISTSSIVLQNAVMNEYLPLLSDVMQDARMVEHPILASLRKGKAHYVCDERLQQRLGHIERSKAARQKQGALLSLKRNVDLDRARHLSGYDRVRVCVPSVCTCGGRNCRYRRYIARCSSERFLFQICNHNLLLADAIHRASKQPPILPDCCVLILDEGHKLPEVSRQMFGVTLYAKDLRALISTLHIERYVLAAECLSSAAKPLLKLLEQPAGDRDFTRYAEQMAAPYQMLVLIRHKLDKDLKPSTRHCLHELISTMEVMLLRDGTDDLVRYCTDGDDGGTVLCATVYALGERLQQVLWSQHQGIILTSGTLAVQEDFSRFRKETGLVQNDRVVESVAQSPFDYRQNCLLYLPEHPPKFREDPKKYHADLTAEIAALLDAAYGHALVLFMSYDLMEAVADRLKEEQLIFPVFTIRKNNSYTLEKFRNHPGAVLLATGSAWEGMDFPGDQVSLLIIPKLPFSAPDELRKRQQKEYDTLQEFIRAIVVPEMQIKLRQGFGRAIRTETDTCVVAILDERSIPGGRYHEAMLEALPEIPITTDIVEVAEFYLDRKPDRYFKKLK